MNEYPALAVWLLLGAGLGLLYYGGLWITVSRFSTTRRPALVLFVSYLVRLTVVAVCFILIVRGGQWQHLLVCLAGVVLVQAVMMWRFGRKRKEFNPDKIGNFNGPGE